MPRCFHLWAARRKRERTDVSSVKLAKTNFVVNTNNGQQVLIMEPVVYAINAIVLWVISKRSSGSKNTVSRVDLVLLPLITEHRFTNFR